MVDNDLSRSLNDLRSAIVPLGNGLSEVFPGGAIDDYNVQQKAFEKIARQAVKHYDAAHRKLGEWRQMVLFCEESFDEAREAMFKDFFSMWISLADAIIEKDRSIRLARQVFALTNDRVSGLIHRKASAATLLEKWVSPKPSTSPALRTRELSPEGKAKLRQILDERRK